MSRLIPILAILISVGGCSSKEDPVLPYIGDHQLVTKMVDGKEVTDTVYHSIPDFELINQDCVVVTQNDVEGKVYVADFFFRSCPSICPRMTDQLIRLQKMTKELDNFMILSHTIDPERDTPEKLKAYAKKNRCDLSNWHFLHGDRDTIYPLGMLGYYLSMGEADDSPGGFIHSETFVLVDQNRNIRGMYRGTQANEVEQLFEDIQLLLK